MKTCSTFVDLKAASKDILVKEGIIADSNLKILNLDKFNAKIEEWSKTHKDQKLWLTGKRIGGEYYAEFNSELSNDILDPEIDNTQHLIQKTKDIIYTKMAKLEERIKANRGNKELQEKYFKYLDSLKTDIANQETTSGIMKFLNIIDRECNQRLQHLEDKKNTGKTLSASEISYLKTFLDMGNVVDELSKEINTNTNSPLFPNKVRSKVLLNRINNKLKEIKDRVYTDDYDAASSFLSSINTNKNLDTNKIKSLLQKGFGDVSWFSRWLDVARDSTDVILSLLAQKIQESKFLGRTKADKVNKEIAELSEELIAYQKSKGVSAANHQAVYEPFLERTKEGKLTGFMVRETTFEWRMKVREFYRLNPEPTKQEVKIFFKSIEGIKLNPKYTAIKNNPNYDKWYEGVLKIKQESDKNIGDVSLYKIPTLYKQELDTIVEHGVFSKQAAEALKNKFKVTTLDTNYQEGSTISGNPVSFLPIHFNVPFEQLDVNQLSLNLGSSLMAYNSMSYNYGELNKIVDDVENVRDLMAKRQVVITDKGIGSVNTYIAKLRNKFGDKTDIDESPTRIKQGSETLAYQQLNDYLDAVFYDKPSERALLFGADITKTIDTINGYTGLAKLSFNVFQSGSQFFTGALWRKVEALGATEFNSNDLNKATKEYTKEVTDLSVIRDSVSNIPKHKINVLRKYFNVGKQHTGIDSNLSKILDTKYSAALLNSGTDHMLSSITMMSVLNNIKVKNKSGEDVSLYDALDVDSSGNIIKKFPFEFTDKDAFLTSQKISTINRNIDGSITPDDEIALKRNAYGRLVMLFRNWVAPSYLSRFGYTYDEEGKIKGRFNQSLGRETLGYYTETLLYLKEVSKELKTGNFKGAMAIWDKLDNSSKKNLIKFGSEMSFLTATLLLAKMLVYLQAGDDDEDKNALLSTMAVLANRVNTEMSQYVNPWKTQELMRSPAASMTMLESTINLFNQVVGFKIDEDGVDFNINDIYESGKRKGDLKIITPIKTNILIWNSIDQFTNINEHKALD